MAYRSISNNYIDFQQVHQTYSVGGVAGAGGVGSELDTTVTAAELSTRVLAVLRGHSGPVYAVDFSRDDCYVVSCSH